MSARRSLRMTARQHRATRCTTSRPPPCRGAAHRTCGCATVVRCTMRWGVGSRCCGLIGRPMWIRLLPRHGRDDCRCQCWTWTAREPQGCTTASLCCHGRTSMSRGVGMRHLRTQWLWSIACAAPANLLPLPLRATVVPQIRNEFPYMCQWFTARLCNRGKTRAIMENQTLLPYTIPQRRRISAIPWAAPRSCCTCVPGVLPLLRRYVRVVLDNLSTHKPKRDLWLARHPDVHFRYTPTHTFWLNQIG